MTDRRAGLVNLLDVRESLEYSRGCGFRKPGGFYIVADGLMQACLRLPFAVNACPTCGSGIKPARGWTWIDAGALLADEPCGFTGNLCDDCALHRLDAEALRRCGLLWVGASFYPQVGDFTSEAHSMGVSRRLPANQIPVGLTPGVTRVFLGHREAILDDCEGCAGTGRNDDEACADCEGSGTVCVPGIFASFVPSAIEYIVRDDDSPDKLARIAARGVRLVRVLRIGENIDIEFSTANSDS